MRGLAFLLICTSGAAVAGLPADPLQPSSAVSAEDSATAPEPAPMSPETAAIVARNRIVLQGLYPRAARRRGEEGDVHYRINVSRDGHFDGCQITRSSGYRSLDDETCDVLLRGATTTPVVAADGWRQHGWREGVLSWVLPDGAPRPATKPRFTATSNADGEKLLCRRVTRVGSLYLTQKLCLTADDWQRQYRYARENVVAMQSPMGPNFVQ